nr:cysteine desulfurase family protein [Candidatus Sigynarchaeota archaeon]
KQLLDQARETIAKCLKASPEEIVFTGSGTESDNLAIQGAALALKKKGNHVITSNIEHPAVKNTVKYLESLGFKTTEVPVDKDGILMLDKLRDAITPQTTLITVMYANNEIGTIQPIKEICEMAATKGIIVHTDAVQAFGKILTIPGTDGFQLLSASAHKIYGPKGVGLLYLKGGGTLKDTGKYVQPIIQGGGHERGYRPATENIAGIVGFAKACEIAFKTMKEEAAQETKLRDKIIDYIVNKIAETELNGHRTRRLPNNVNASFKHVEGESLLLRLDMAGYECSTGSACSSHNLKASHVLLAIGRDPEIAHGSLRITIGRTTTAEKIDRFLADLEGVVASLRAFSPTWNQKKRT